MKVHQTLREMCDAQARKARERYDAEMARYAWSSIKVKYCADQREWVVWGHCNPKHHSYDGREREVISTERLRKDAIEEAKLYAFDTSCGPMRAERVDIYRKDGVWLDSIHAPLSPLKR